jgi:hypothetical protein
MNTAMIIFLVSGLIFLAMVLMLSFRKQPDYGKDSRSSGMSYERYKTVNGNGRI